MVPFEDAKEGRESVDHFTGVPKGGGSGALVTRSSGKDFFLQTPLYIGSLF